MESLIPKISVALNDPLTTNPVKMLKMFDWLDTVNSCENNYRLVVLNCIRRTIKR